MPVMDCGAGVALCGVVVLETGYGPGNYNHPTPALHGLWPQTGSYGTSECIAPGDTSIVTQSSYCYDDLDFQNHEWTKHGYCSGTKDADDFFSQICSLAAAPLKVMTSARQAGGDLGAINASVAEAGYPIFDIDGENSQIYLSACAANDGKWLIADVSDFPSRCHWSGPTPTPPPSPSPSPSPSPTSQCVPSTHGPACNSDADCEGATDCVRCAHSGYCTDVPLANDMLV